MTLTVEAGKTLTPPLGTPVGVRITEDVRYAHMATSQPGARKSEIHLMAEKRDASGMIVTHFGVGPRRTPPTAPLTFKIVNAAGATVHAGTMEYG